MSEQRLTERAREEVKDTLRLAILMKEGGAKPTKAGRELAMHVGNLCSFVGALAKELESAEVLVGQYREALERIAHFKFDVWAALDLHDIKAIADAALSETPPPQ